MTVSVIIPTFNRVKSVGRAVESVLSQTRRPEELIVVDDGSTDGTADVLRSRFGAGIRILIKPNGGVASARNHGVAAASQPLVAFLDSDDVWMPKKLELQLKLMAEPGVVACYTDWAYSKSPDKSAFRAISLPVSGPTLVETPLRFVARLDGGAAMIQSMVVRRDVMQRIGGFDERMSIAEDTRAIYRLAFEGRFAIVPEILFLWHLGEAENNLTQTHSPDYLRMHAANAVEILLEAYARAWQRPAGERRLLRRGLGYHLLRHSMMLARERRAGLARRRAFESIFFGVSVRDALRAALIALSPSFYGWQARERQPVVREPFMTPSGNGAIQ
jgi:glycosyltransferase involved in cell wall biosynthesis